MSVICEKLCLVGACAGGQGASDSVPFQLFVMPQVCDVEQAFQASNDAISRSSIPLLWHGQPTWILPHHRQALKRLTARRSRPAHVVVPGLLVVMRFGTLYLAMQLPAFGEKKWHSALLLADLLFVLLLAAFIISAIPKTATQLAHGLFSGSRAGTFFVSYCWGDGMETAHHIARLFPFETRWLDIEKLLPGSQIAEECPAAAAHSEARFALVSDAYLRSRNCGLEWAQLSKDAEQAAKSILLLWPGERSTPEEVHKLQSAGHYTVLLNKLARDGARSWRYWLKPAGYDTRFSMSMTHFDVFNCLMTSGVGHAVLRRRSPVMNGNWFSESNMSRPLYSHIALSIALPLLGLHAVVILGTIIFTRGIFSETLATPPAGETADVVQSIDDTINDDTNASAYQFAIITLTLLSAAFSVLITLFLLRRGAWRRLNQPELGWLLILLHNIGVIPMRSRPYCEGETQGAVPYVVDHFEGVVRDVLQPLIDEGVVKILSPSHVLAAETAGLLLVDDLGDAPEAESNKIYWSRQTDYGAMSEAYRKAFAGSMIKMGQQPHPNVILSSVLAQGLGCSMKHLTMGQGGLPGLLPDELLSSTVRFLGKSGGRGRLVQAILLFLFCVALAFAMFAVLYVPMFLAQECEPDSLERQVFAKAYRELERQCGNLSCRQLKDTIVPTPEYDLPAWMAVNGSEDAVVFTGCAVVLQNLSSVVEACLPALVAAPTVGSWRFNITLYNRIVCPLSTCVPAAFKPLACTVWGTGDQ